MFDQYARQLIDQLPAIGDLNKETCRRTLSAAYVQLMRSQLRLDQQAEATGDAVVRDTLRRMADSLESAAVFDALNGVVIEPATESACAFVAAEAVFFLHELAGVRTDTASVGVSEGIDVLADSVRHPQIYLNIEAALLYMIGGYDVNAGTLAARLPNFFSSGSNQVAGAVADNARYLISRISAFCRGSVAQISQGVPFRGMDNQPAVYETLIEETRVWLYRSIAEELNRYLNWLGGYPGGSLEGALESLRRIRQSLLPNNQIPFAPYSDIYHLVSLLIAAIDRTSARSVYHETPRPSAEEAFSANYEKYLLTRVRGTTEQAGRPFLWPSSAEFVERCLPGPKCDAVISMPTGSGKSFVAELAIVDALSRGNVIYLAPTNALVHQIRRDLMESLSAFDDLHIAAFVGGGEYTNQMETSFDNAGARFVAVMTPEKCSLALRLSPENFKDVALCVFDECHLLNDSKRGVISDILIANLFVACPQVHFLLMSAMVSNAEELASWLAQSRGSEAIPSVTKWRPSRTLRGFLFLNKAQTDAAFAKASGDLRLTRLSQPSRVNNPYDAELGLVANLSGPWTQDGESDYTAVALGSYVPAVARWKGDLLRVIADYGGWKNKAARTVAEQLGQVGISTIAFVLTSRHHAFSLARDVSAQIPGSIGDNPLPPLVNAWLAVSSHELGVTTVLEQLLRRGVAVHTSAMLQTEQAASEWMFSKQHAKLMFATPTLAQGLNLPAIAVIVAGTSMGNPAEKKDADEIEGLAGRVEALILNGFGRAGRPGFSNQGVGILVSDSPYFGNVVGAIDASPVVNRYPVLTHADASVAVRSPIEQFLDRMIANVDTYDHNTASEVELELTTLLAESTAENNHAGHILKRTFAAYRQRAKFTDEIADRVNARIATLKQEFLDQDGIPGWMNTAAMKAGVTVFRASRMWSAYLGRGKLSLDEVANYDIEAWLSVFIQVMAELPPGRVQRYMADDTVKTASFLTRLRDAAGTSREADEYPWTKPAGWFEIWIEVKELLWAYMRGETLVALAAKHYNVTPESVSGERTSGKLPGIFAVIQRIFEQLAIDAGCFVALTEHHWKEVKGDSLELPQGLQALPLCIRSGTDSISTLGWFRFGYRQRMCAHSLSERIHVPDQLSTDQDMSAWIRKVRKNWLDDGFDGEPEVLRHARTILTQA